MNSKPLITARKSTLALAIALAAAAPAFAGTSAPAMSAGYPAGEALAIELPSMRTPVPEAAPVATVDTPTAAVTPAVTPAAAPTSDTAMGETTLTADSNTVQVAAPVAMIVVQPVVIEPAPITRESVRAEFLAARQAGTLTPANDIGDTPQVLAAREAFNREQTASILAAYQANYDQQVAMQEAEIRRAAIEAEWLQQGVAQAAVRSDDPMAEVQIDVISMQPQAAGE